MKLQEILKVCEDFISSPEDKEILESYNKMLQELTIKTYMPMQEKVIALVRMTIDSDKDRDIDESFFTAGVELAACFDGLLSYITNLEQEVNLEIKNYENYDLIYQSGLADYILQYCEKDYQRLIKMFERTFSYMNLNELISSMESMDTGSLKALTTTIKGLKDEIDPKIISDLADIMRYNDSNFVAIKENIVDRAMDDLDKVHK